MLDMKIFKNDELPPDQKITNIIKVGFGGLILHYQQENIMRIKEYFFDKFLDAIIGDNEEIERFQGTMKWFTT